MVWANPKALFWCIAVGLGSWVLFRQIRARERALQTLIDPSVWNQMIPGLSFRRERLKAWLQVLGFLFAILAFSRPQWGVKEEWLKQSGLDVMIAVDVSNSMDAEDLQPSRLKRVQHSIKGLLDQMQGDRVGIMAFAASSHVISPLTTDLGYVSQTVDILNTRMIQNQGTSLKVALETAIATLERGAENPSASPNETTPSEGKQSGSVPSRVLLVFTDGEDHDVGAETFARKLSQMGVQIFFIGVGTPEGGPIPLRDMEGRSHGFKKDRRGQTVVTKLNLDALKALASSASAQYAVLSSQETEIREIMRQIGLMDRADFQNRRVITHEDRFYIPLALAIIFWLLELFLSRTVIKGVAAGLLLLGMISSGEAYAGTLEAYQKNKEGIKAYEAGQVDEAKQKFAEAQALLPKSPEIQFNRSTAELDSKETADALADVAKTAKQAGNRDLESKAYYNRGHAMTNAKDIGGAAESYLDAILSAPPESQVAEAARHNLKLLIKDPPQQKQSGSDGKSDKDNEKDKDQQQKDSQQKSGRMQESKKQEFKSKELKREDASRIVSEMNQRDQALQSQLNRRKDNSSERQEEDW